MQQTISLIDTVLQVTHRGGKLLQRDDSSIILTDYDCLPHKALQQIEDQCPGWNIEIVQADVSTSGFVIIFTKHFHKHAWQSSACMQMTILILILCAVGSFALKQI